LNFRIDPDTGTIAQADTDITPASLLLDEVAHTNNGLASTGAENAALSTTITSNVPIVAERAMYLNSTARQWEGGAASAGATALSTRWSMAEGATGFFYTYLLLGNPNADETTVTVRYQWPDGEILDKTYAVPGQSRRTIDVRGEDPRPSPPPSA
jgi:hypothetical protein